MVGRQSGSHLSVGDKLLFQPIENASLFRWLLFLRQMENSHFLIENEIQFQYL
jgi:hypothetical protein